MDEEIVNFRSQKSDTDLLLKGLSNLDTVLRSLGYSNLREGQDRGVTSILGGQDTICVFPTSAGKCLGKDTPVIRYDGTVCPVQDLQVGDRLLGPDSKPRRIESVCQGREEMFRISPKQGGESYVVNRSHILSLQLNPGGAKGDRIRVNGVMLKGGDTVNMTVDQYLKCSKTVKHRAKGWRAEAVHFHAKPELIPSLPPYLLGVWLGDGSHGSTAVSVPDEEVVGYLRKHAQEIGAHFYDGGGKNSCPTWCTSFPEIKSGRRGGSNTMLNALRQAGVLEDKHIPAAYLTSSLDDRLELLAGLLDTAGHLHAKGRSYEITTKYPKLAENILFLARSCGFYASVGDHAVKLEGWEESRMYKRVYLSGDLSRVPCKVARKKAKAGPPKRSTSRFAFTVESLGAGDYYGFELSGPDRLFLLGDFTVTHNTGTFIIPTLCHGWRMLVFSPLKALMRDQVRGLQAQGIFALCLSSDNKEIENLRAIADWVKGDCKILYIAPERLKNEEFMKALKRMPPDVICVDEAHCLSDWGDNFRHNYIHIGDVIDQFNPRVVAAFTATMTEKIEVDVRKVLRMPDAVKIFHYPVRTNLKLSSSDIDLFNDLPERVASVDGPVLVYCGSKRLVEETARSMSRYLKEEVGFYHSEVNESTKKMYQDQFFDDRIRVLCATNAFGMGVDKPNIRAVFHLMHPGSPEALAQEVGRAGRDGKDSWCHTYESKSAIRMQQDFIRQGYPPEDYYDRIFEFMRKKADAAGLFHLTGKDIEEGSGVYLNYHMAIMQALQGARVIEDVAEATRMHKIKFLRDSEIGRYIQMEDAVSKVAATEGGWQLFDIDVVAQLMDVGKPTVAKYIKSWQAENLIAYEAPPPGKAKRIVGDLSLIDFERLALKRKMANEKLDYVLGYFKVPDGDKHAYLQEYFVRASK